jgi:RNA polymerase sigma-B factor
MTSATWRDTKGGYGHLRPLFDTAGTPDWEQARERLITEYLPVAEHIAQRFRHRGETHDDLLQVATVGLINAVDRFDAGRGTDFLAFAVPTIMGEVRRHFRDTGWAIRVPRRLQERHLAISAASADLAQTLGRAATPSELAARLGLSKEEIYEGIEAGNVYRAQSLDEILGPDEDDSPVADRMGAVDDALDGVEYHETLRPMLERLPARERRILLLRFYGNLTQTEIARRVGLSQMHVSRLLSKTLQSLREDITKG